MTFSHRYYRLTQIFKHQSMLIADRRSDKLYMADIRLVRVSKICVYLWHL